MSNFRCSVCGYIYDEENEGKLFKNLPASWFCPICGAPTSAFHRMGKDIDEAEKELAPAPIVASKILEQLAAIGVKRIYGIPGDSNLPLVEALSQQDQIQFILTRDERTAAFMASAHAKITGELGVCLSIAGPGATNLITGLMDAATDGVPVLALVGQVAQVFIGSESLQEIDEIELFQPFTVFNETIANPAQTLRLVTLAIKNAYAQRGVAMLSLPTDILAEELSDPIWKPEEHIFRQVVTPLDEDLEKAAKIINQAKRPIILGGWGIRSCGEKLLQFAQKISAMIATTSRAKGVIHEDHKLAVGVLGSIGTEYAARAMRKADLIIVIGSGFRQRNLVPDLPIIQVDINGVRLGRSFPIQVGLTGDAEAVLKKLMDYVDQKKPDDQYFSEISDLKIAHQKEVEADRTNMSKPIYPGLVVQVIKKHAVNDAIICADVGDFIYWLYKKYVCTGEKTFMSANMASMGFGLSGALAAQFEYPNRQVICVTGDGGFGMVMADLSTAAFNNLPIKVIVFNDSKLKNIKKEQSWYGYEEYGISFVNPNFADFAKSLGATGFRVEHPEDLDAAIEQAFKSDKPALVDILVDPEAMAPRVKFVPED